MTDGIEKFEITDWDIENEFNPNRVKHHLTKNQQIYGVFASDESEDEERPSFGHKGSSVFSSQINFISGGVRTVGEKPEKKESDDEDEKSSDDEKTAPVSPQKPSFSKQRSGFSGSHRQNQIAGLRAFDKNSSNNEFGSWEKHTKGIGQKLLLQMGYEPGKGLGKSLQGITTPIEAKLRKGKGAIGLYGPEQPTMTRAASTVQSEQADKEDKEKQKHQRQWKKNSADGQLKVKYVYKTADEVVQEGASKRYRGDISALSSVKVIDMTGPEQRILSGYHQIHQQQHSKPVEEDEDEEEKPKTSKGYHFSLPELEHNLKLLEEDEKQKIIRCDRQKQFSEDKIVNLGHEKNRLTQLLIQEEKQIKTLEKVYEIVTSLDNNNESEDSNAALEIAARTFKDLQDEYYEIYKMYNLSDLVIPLVIPRVKKLLADWNPFDQKHHCIDIFQDWKVLLETSCNSVSWNKESDEDPYHQLVWDVWMPPVRKAILNWNARTWSPLVELLDTWTPLLPPWILNNILEQLVLPRLQAEVDAWNPLTDTLPVHSWIHPWLPLMGGRLEILYAPIRQKLAAALVNWHPSDCSAKLILEPWKPVFSQGTMDAFVITNIVPKLAVALQAYVINPHQQHLDVWNWVMAWQDMIPEPCMVTLLEKNFFPKWLQVLYTWLTHSPNYEEVTKWYTGWKSMLPASLLAHPIIKEQFRQALDIMNRAVSAPQCLLGQQPGAKESMAYLANVERQQELDRQVKPRRDYEAMLQTLRAPTSTASLSLSFKDLIEKKAQESNIIFMPVPGRYQEGKQVHRFGSSLLYLDRGTIFVFNQKTWVPTSLQSLLDTAG